MRPRSPFRRDVAVLVTIALATPVLADVDVELRSGDSLRGTFSPADESETLRLSIPAGARIAVKAAGAKRGPATSFALTDPSDAPAGTPVETSRGAKLAHVAATSGAWKVALRSRDAVTTGEYTASVRWTSPRRFGPATRTFGAGATETFTFAADAGARVRVVAVAAHGSAALPRIVAIDGPSGALPVTDDGEGAARETVGPVVVAATGDHTVEIRDTGAGGDVVVTIVVTPARPSRRKVDVRAATIGGGADDGAFARVAGPEGGTITVPDSLDGLAAIAGSSIEVPPGTLPSGVALVIGTAADLDVPDATETGLGPTVFFGPEGTTFGTRDAPKSVTLTIPLDLATVGGDRMKVEVWVRDARGRTTKVPPPYDFDTTPGYVSFPTSHFSAYRAVTLEGTGPVSPFTIGTFPAVADVCGTPDLPSVLDARLLVATGASRTIARISRSVPTTTALFAGGGATVADGTNRLAFDFQGDVTAVTTGGNGDVFVGTATRIFRIAPSGAVTRIAGTGTPGDSGDGGPATSAEFRSCRDMIADLAGNVFFTDSVTGRIRQIQSPSGQMMTVAGTGTAAFGADGVQPSSTTFLDAAGLAFRPEGGFYVCDAGRLRAINLAGPLNITFLGDPAGSTGSVGDHVGPSAARFRGLEAVAVTPDGSVYVADRMAHTIRKYDAAANLVVPVAGVDDLDLSSPDGTAAPFGISLPRGLVFEGTSILWADAPGRVRGAAQ